MGTKTTRAFLISTALLAATAGCTPSFYKEDADRQVKKILENRKETTLGYKPQTEAKTTVSDTPSKKAFDKIPTTPIPPPSLPPMEPDVVKIPYGTLGPPTELYTNPQEPMPDGYGITGTGGERLRLGPPAPVPTEHRMDLFRVIEYAVQNARDYQSEMEQLYLSTLDVTLQRHLFLEPRPFVTSQLRYSEGARDVRYRSALTATESAGVRQRLPYGGEVVAQGVATFVDSLSGNAQDGESANAALSATIPLLRGAGWVNLEPLIQSERQLVYDVRDFEQFRRTFVVNIASRYFNLLSQQQQLYNRRLNYASLTELTARTQALFEAGRQPFLEVQRARQSQLSGESSLIDAEQSYQNAVDNFKIQLGMPIEEDLEIVPVELDIKVPEARTEDVVQVATKYRLDLQTARDQIEDSRRAVQVAKNGLLPSLDFSGDVRAGNDNSRSAFSLNSDTRTYNAGVTLDLPIDRVAERNAYRRSLISLQRTQRSYQTLHDTIAVAARNALRSIRSAQVNLQIQQLSIDLALRRLENSNERLRQGQVTARDVVESQSSLLDAQDAYSNARAQLQNSILQYLNATGTLRVDPDAGALGQAMDRAALQANKVDVPAYLKPE